MTIEQKIRKAIDKILPIGICDNKQETIYDLAEIVKEVAMKFDYWRVHSNWVVTNKLADHTNELVYFNQVELIYRTFTQIYPLFLQEVYGEGKEETGE